VTARVIKRDQEKFGPMIEAAMRYARGSVGRIVIKRFGETAIVDVLQRAALNAWRHRDQFEGRSNFNTWFTSIARNEALMYLRSAKIAADRETSIDQTDLIVHDKATNTYPQLIDTIVIDKAHVPEALLLAKERAVTLKAALAKIDPRLCQVLVLRAIDGFDTQETADALGVSISTVKTRTRRAKIRLRLLLLGEN